MGNGVVCLLGAVLGWSDGLSEEIEPCASLGLAEGNLDAYDRAIAAFEAQLVWRAASEGSLRNQIAEFQQSISGTLGARSQMHMTREQALYLASCNAGHRDLSLNF